MPSGCFLVDSTSSIVQKITQPSALRNLREVPDRRRPLFAEQPVAFFFDHAIAFADTLFQSAPFEDGDASPTVVNESQILQVSGSHSHALPPGTQHPGDEFLGDE